MVSPAIELSYAHHINMEHLFWTSSLLMARDTRYGPAISSRFEAQSGAAGPWACRGNAERWLGLVPSPPIEHSSLKAVKQEILEPRMKHGWNTDRNPKK